MPKASREQSYQQLESRYKRITKYRKHRRGFREVPLYPVGHQIGKQRFPRRDSDNNALPKAPKINQWRNNLTAVSQRYNLYVVACLDVLYGYQPEFPDQTLPSTPLFTWKLPVSQTGLPGHIPSEPGQPYSAHSVNNLIIADLGDLEILVCACDDGDVLAMYTESLCNFEHSTPRLLLHDNVQKSAWGLSVHSAARLIAVSSNGRQVTVYAPALETDPSLEKSRCFQRCADQFFSSAETWNMISTVDDLTGSLQEQPSKTYGPLIFRYNRVVNFKLVLKGHQNNIPCISFCNTDDDPEGRYLASTDLNGCTIIWDIYKARPVRRIAPNGEFRARRLIGEVYPQIHGWGIHFLNPKVFAPTKSIVQATGTCHKVSLWPRSHRISPAVEVYDISESQIKVQNAGPRWDLDGGPTSSAQGNTSATVDASNTASHYLGLDSDSPSSNDADAGDVNAGVSEQDDSSNEDEDEFKSSRGPMIHSRAKSAFQENKQGRIHEDALALEVIEDMGHVKWSMFCHTIARDQEVDYSHVVSKLKSPVMLINPKKIHLFQTPSFDWYCTRDEDSPEPIIMLDDPLEQMAPHGIANILGHHDRLSLFASIPELGVVLVGSPKGRVAVLSLHLLLPDRDSQTGEYKTDIRQEMYTMRLDHIIPFQDEEECELRPLQPLAGICAGPIHPHTSQTPTRYRIFLTFTNHTVLVYEIGREGSDSYKNVMTF